MTTTTITAISLGFLDGNLWDGVNADAYAEELECRLKAAFPGADIEIDHQPAEGSPPVGYELAVETSDGEVRYEYRDPWDAAILSVLNVIEQFHDDLLTPTAELAYVWEIEDEDEYHVTRIDDGPPGADDQI